MNEIIDSNLEFYKREIELANTIRRRNRYDTVTGEWLGPDPEPEPDKC